MEDIKTVRSHSQALGQCRNIISKNNLKAIVSADTAGSAKLISEKKDNLKIPGYTRGFYKTTELNKTLTEYKELN